MTKRKKKKKGLRYATDVMRKVLLERDNFTCRYCGIKVTNSTANMDHVVPYAKGGKTRIKNLVVACRKCNKFKRNKQGILPNPIKERNSLNHRAVGCKKVGCLLRHHDLWKNQSQATHFDFGADYDLRQQFEHLRSI